MINFLAVLDWIVLCTIFIVGLKFLIDGSRRVFQREWEEQILNKRNQEQEKEALEWIESVLGEMFPAKERYEDIIRDGQVLCRLMNKLSPNSVPKIHSAGSQFKMMENINNFLKAIQAYGVSDVDLFQTVDLFEKKDIGQVTTTLFSLGRATYTHPEWPGPWLGPKPSEEHKRSFTTQQLRSGESVIGLQAGFNRGATQAGQNFGAGRKILLGK